MRCLWPNFDKRRGLVVAVAQAEKTGRVLMVAFVHERAFRRTLKTGMAHYAKTSEPTAREPLGRTWQKGEESGNVQRVIRVLVDCDGDAIVYVVRQTGAACHTGQHSCFFRDVLEDVSQAAFPSKKEKLLVIEVRVAAPLRQKGTHRG